MRLALAAATLIVCAATSQGALLGPSPYLSFADSPFNGPSFSVFFLETFESGALTTPGVTISAGTLVTSPGAFTDSVDGDDGVIDGSGAGGHSLLNTSTNIIRFTFNAAALGGSLPTHAGIVWTDVGAANPTIGLGLVSFQAFDAASISLGSIGPFTLGDGSALGATAEDRFFGVTNASGISAIEITTSNSTDWEVDHLQYGIAATAVPEPATWTLIAAALFTLLVASRSRTQSEPRA